MLQGFSDDKGTISLQARSVKENSQRSFNAEDPLAPPNMIRDERDWIKSIYE